MHFEKILENLLYQGELVTTSIFYFHYLLFHYCKSTKQRKDHIELDIA